MKIWGKRNSEYKDKISNVKALIKENEGDEVLEEGRKMLDKIDCNLKKTQERFFEKKNDIDIEIEEVYILCIFLYFFVFFLYFLVFFMIFLSFLRRKIKILRKFQRNVREEHWKVLL